VNDFNRLRKRLQSSSERPKVVIVGGGISGLKTLLELKRRRIDAILIEKRGELGGVWSETPHIATYCGLVLNTHFRQMMLSGDMPADLAERDYLKHAEYSQYVSNFIAENIDLVDVYQNCEVTSIRRKSHSVDSAALFNVEAVNPSRSASTNESFECSAVIICHGACDTPRIPDLGDHRETSSRLIHSSQISPLEISAGQKVLLVGFGNTAGDYAVTMVERGCQVSISTQNRTWIVPKTIEGQSIDIIVQGFQRRYGGKYGEQLFSHLQDIAYCSDSDHSGSIDYRNSRIVKNDLLPILLKNRNVAITGKVQRVSNGQVEFDDGQSSFFDTIIFCTGYQENSSLLKKENLGRLVANMFSENWYNVYFVGAQPLWGGTGAIIEKQVSIIADCLQDVRRHREISDSLKVKESNLDGIVSFENGTKLYSLQEYSNLTDF
jgi:cation diffusion facilitator CzcD-associated flavoprotein CzcO